MYNMLAQAPHMTFWDWRHYSLGAIAGRVQLCLVGSVPTKCWMLHQHWLQPHCKVQVEIMYTDKPASLTSEVFLVIRVIDMSI